LKSVFQQECLKRGVLFTGSQNICYTHSREDDERTLAVYDIALERLAAAVASGDPQRFLEGRAVQPVFRQP
jgi:glutamate-1-semialdehyde 2,1-aminomutase/spore coat polysaccharide biosynthesis protein SpsF